MPVLITILSQGVIGTLFQASLPARLWVKSKPLQDPLALTWVVSQVLEHHIYIFVWTYRDAVTDAVVFLFIRDPLQRGFANYTSIKNRPELRHGRFGRLSVPIRRGPKAWRIAAPVQHQRTTPDVRTENRLRLLGRSPHPRRPMGILTCQFNTNRQGARGQTN